MYSACTQWVNRGLHQWNQILACFLNEGLLEGAHFAGCLLGGGSVGKAVGGEQTSGDLSVEWSTVQFTSSMMVVYLACSDSGWFLTKAHHHVVRMIKV